MPEVIAHNLVEVLVEALEQMAFVTVGPLDETPKPPADALLVSVDFSGPVCGRVELLADKALGKVMAANMLASTMDDPQVEQQAHDALRELLNVTCGALLSQWTAQMAGTFHMRIPDVKPIDASGWQELMAAGDFLPLDADGQVIAVRLAERA